MGKIKKILIIQTAFPGDAILTLPFIQELKKKSPDYLIDILCIPSTAEIFAASPHVNSIILFDKKGKQKTIFAFIKFIKEIKSKDYEIVYSPHRSLRSALIAMNLSAKETYGFDNNSLKFAFKHSVKYDPSVHEVKRNLEFVGDDYSIDRWRIIPEITVTAESKKKVQKFLSENKIDKFIVIAPGSVWETKKYPVENYRLIIEHFTSVKYQIMLIGGAEDKNLCETLKSVERENVFITAGDFSFVETIELLKSSSLLICNDSAPTHLGVSADIPVLTIYCSTVPQFGFYPYNKKSDHISYDNLACKPCGIHGYNSCPIGTFDCAKLLFPDLVIEKAEKLLSNGR
ncbi:MAG: glycosyltransferase family 9 protein [Ignavibacteriaceae bacterium]|nr:glycosyltransferase family 9 protein [Ignavibacteriaceae bacterium]